jgi:hypothetical protein
MFSLVKVCQDHDNLSILQSRFQTLLPLVEMHARAALREVACPHAMEDLVADVVTFAWEALVQLSEKAVIISMDASGLAALGLRLARERQSQECDVLSPHARARLGFKVVWLN